MNIPMPSNYRMRGESQEHYCADCALNIAGGCNVFLKDEEACGDKIVDNSIPDGPYCGEEGN